MFSLVFELVVADVQGIRSITTVSEVSVKAGYSVSIPCLYDSQYRDNVKYLCKGYYFNSCSYAIRTNQPNSRKFSISDDKTQRIFTVTIKDLTYQDSDYWCAVEINDGKDVRKYFHLSVTRGFPSLPVAQQEITGFNGENINFNCYHHNPGEMKWCRLGSSCVTGSSGSIDGTTVTINASISNVFTVTMSGLRTQSSGWYMCVKGDLQMPVHLTVSERPTTTTSEPVSLTTASEPGNLNTSFTEKAPNVAHGEQHRVSVDLKSFMIPLCLLILIVMVTLFIWFRLKKRKQIKDVSTPAKTEADEQAMYSTVDIRKKSSGQPSYTESDVDIIYSSVVTTRQKRARRVEANDENVTYSTLA
uniref:uncharacterized protein LOC124065760 isoform X2 n=1 Tax=Scatophagus argus TaxID=75038 RepID=UPI001ED817B5|nr:uncharacterized protein LOC124065760 isoform X2 [Scatophagus argus]XP_046257422.1 uncharacterized protein LOC124065760 isoform X2 [Scatophagus argus]XP_046257423.1 uncharacterized protein LOC124065760 isoform X2 [Scatophagus argus]